MSSDLFIGSALQNRDVIQFERPALNQQAKKIAKNIIYYGSELCSDENCYKFSVDRLTDLFNTAAVTVPLVFVGCCAMSITAQGNGSGFRTLLETTGHELSKLYSGTIGHLPTLALLTCVSTSLQYLTSSNNVSIEQKFSLKEKSVSLLKEKSNNFLAGVSSSPRDLYSSVCTIAITVAMLWAFSIENANAGNIGFTQASYDEYVAKLSYIDLAIVGPFFEEVFYRACIQSLINSSLKIVNSTSRQFRMGEISNSTISKCSRIGSSVLFGLCHYGSLAQMVATGVISYFSLSQLYDEKGFFASFGAHVAFNSIFSVRQALLTLALKS